ncbi:MAG: DUF4097 family beta strand repeat-containing protein [Balneolaceae bacterium]|nr:DUF4097 family beta strand repeat-containing protein [Balneolaceae bacterium]
MKRFTQSYLTLLLFALLLVTAIGNAQDQQVTIPLSNPGEPGKLMLGMVRGGISVTGYEGSEVIIQYSSEDERDQKVTPDGLRRISGNSAGFQVQENDNKVEIGSVSPMQQVYFRITVPRNFSVNLSLVHGSDLAVENVEGELEISHVNGDVTLNNVSGSASVTTVNGNITASFSNVYDNKPMAFSNVDGDITVTLPARARISAKMKSDWGDVYTDFEMDIRRTENERVSHSDSDVFKVSVNDWIYGDINGGGPEYLFKSLRGDIYIRKQ